MLTYVIDSMFDLVQLLKHFDLVMTGGRVCVACSDKLGVKQTETQVLVQHVSPESPGKHVFIELDNNATAEKCLVLQCAAFVLLF